MRGEPVKLVENLSSEISKAYNLLDLGKYEFAMIALRKAIEALCEYLADSVGLYENERKKKYLFGASILSHDKVKERYDEDLLDSIQDINKKIRSYAHFQSKEKMNELKQNSQSNFEYCISLLCRIVKENIDAKFEIKRLHHDSIHKFGFEQGSKAFDEMTKLFFRYGNTDRYNDEFEKLMDTTFSTKENENPLYRKVQHLLKEIDLTKLIDVENPSDELYFYLINSNDEEAIRTAGKLSIKHSNHRWTCAANYVLGELLYSADGLDKQRVNYMKKSILNFRNVQQSDLLDDLFDEVVIEALIRACDSYHKLKKYNWASALISELENEVGKYGNLRTKFAYYYTACHNKCKLNQGHKGRYFARKALEIAEIENNAEMKCDATMLMALSAQVMGENTLADNFFQEAKEIAVNNDIKDRLKGFSVVEGFSHRLYRT